MDLETRYKMSKDVINPTRYSEKTVFDKDHSNLNIDGTSKKYSGVTIHSDAESNLDIKNTPKKYHG